jgi:TnpA family transposase
LIARHLPDMFQVAQSIKAGVISPSTILRKLGTASRKNRLYYAFRELGRVIRTISLLEYLADVDLQRLVNAMTNKTELFHDFAKWAYFAEDTIQENVRDEQVKIIKYNHLIANLLIFHNVYSMTRVLNELESKGIVIRPEMLSALSPYRTGHINRFGIYEVRDREVGEINYALQITGGNGIASRSSLAH